MRLMFVTLRFSAALCAFCALALSSACGRGEPAGPSAGDAPVDRTVAPDAQVPPIAPHRVFITNELSGDLTIAEGATLEVLATVPLGRRPRGVQASPDGKLLYVALSGSPLAPPGVDESTLPPADKSADGIGVFDVAARRLVRVVRGVSDPEQLAVSRDGARLYVASEDTGTAVILDAASGEQLATLPVGGEPEGVAISPDGTVVYMSSEEDHTITVIDTALNRAVKRFEVGRRPRAIAFAPDGRRAWVTGETDASVAVVDTATHTVIHTVKLAGENVRPMGVVVAPDGGTVYVATGRGGTVVAIDASNHAPRATVRVGDRPWGLAISPDGRRLYTANGPSNDVSVVDAERFEVVATLEAGERPWGALALPQ